VYLNFARRARSWVPTEAYSDRSRTIGNGRGLVGRHLDEGQRETWRPIGAKEVKMRQIQTIMVIAGLLFSLTVSAENTQAPEVTNRIEPLPRDLEIQLALSALPPRLRDNATVYVLNPAKGFEVARKGTSEFHAFVARTGDDTFKGSWPLVE